MFFFYFSECSLYIPYFTHNPVTSSSWQISSLGVTKRGIALFWCEPRPQFSAGMPSKLDEQPSALWQVWRIVSGSCLPTVTAGICSRPWKKEVASNPPNSTPPEERSPFPFYQCCPAFCSCFNIQHEKVCRFILAVTPCKIKYFSVFFYYFGHNLYETVDESDLSNIEESFYWNRHGRFKTGINATKSEQMWQSWSLETNETINH